MEQRIYEIVRMIPYGKVTTYVDIAIILGNKGLSRYVGSVLKNNPYSIYVMNGDLMVPCHRVIKSDRTIGGFFGATNGDLIRQKIQILQNEGVIFETNGKICVQSIIHANIK